MATLDPSSTLNCTDTPLTTTANVITILILIYIITISIWYSITSACTAKQDIHTTIIEADSLIRLWTAHPWAGGLTPLLRSAEAATAAQAVQEEIGPLKALRVKLGDALEERGMWARVRAHWGWVEWSRELRGRTERVKVLWGVYERGLKGRPWERCGYCGSG